MYSGIASEFESPSRHIIEETRMVSEWHLRELNRTLSPSAPAKVGWTLPRLVRGAVHGLRAPTKSHFREEMVRLVRVCGQR